MVGAALSGVGCVCVGWLGSVLVRAIPGGAVGAGGTGDEVLGSVLGAGARFPNGVGVFNAAAGARGAERSDSCVGAVSFSTNA